MAGKFGNAGLVLGSAGDISADRNGLWTGACQFTFPPGRYDLIPGINSPHPHARFLTMERFRVSHTRGLWQLAAEYAGCPDEESIGQFELSPGTGNEPIETHDKFLSELAGKPGAERNGAIFRDPVTGEVTQSSAPGTYTFDRFAIYLEDGSLNPFAGQEQYIAQNNTVWTKTWTRRSPPQPTGIRISEPEGGAPDYGGATNWLEMPVAYAQRGLVYACTTRHLASGPRGWNTAVYPST